MNVFNLLTFPHEDLLVEFVDCTFCFDSINSSSAKPQEQSLHAFRFPVVPQTIVTQNHCRKEFSAYYAYVNLPFKSVGFGLALSFSSSKSFSSMRSPSLSDNFHTFATLSETKLFLLNDSLEADPIS